MQITKVEVKTASNGNSYKQVTVAEKVFGDKDRFNIFNNHSKYEKCVEGVDIPQDLLFVNDKGYLDLKDEESKQKKTDVNEMAIKHHITQEIAPVREALRQIIEHLDVEAPKPKVGNTDIEYPDGSVDTFTEEEIKENIPF